MKRINGTVRFRHGKFNMVLREIGISIYPAKRVNSATLYLLMAEEDFREKLSEAIEALDRPYGGVSVIIPPHMKA